MPFSPFNIQSQRWSFWTYLISLAVLLSGSLISYYLRNFTDSLLLYLPTSVAIVLVHWFGVRVLPFTYINSLFTLYLWGAPGGVPYLMLLATREPIIVFVSWALANKIFIGTEGLSNAKVFVQFVLLGIVIPDIVNSFYTYHYTFINKDLEKVALLWLSDFITIFSITLPLIHFFKPVRSGIAFKLVRSQKEFSGALKIGIRELIFVTGLFLTLSFFIDFGRYWFIYGIVASLVAVRNGFETVVIANSVIFLLNYILPLIDFTEIVHGTTQRLNVHMGMGTMFFVSSLVGRAISDSLNTESELTQQKKRIEESNEKLTRANIEMDRFVYSVSHDISAPLKSIMGLINLSRLEQKQGDANPYLDKIEQSARKLEDFVAEVLDHSRANRKEIQLEQLNLKATVAEIIENLKYLDKSHDMQFRVEIQEELTLLTDRFLLKVVLSNIISNAIKYQKSGNRTRPEILVEASMDSKALQISIKDNGQGISDETKPKIFDMFYRGTAQSSGSGLGLYIAREAVERLHGKISFESTYGLGSTFSISIPRSAVVDVPGIPVETLQ